MMNRRISLHRRGIPIESPDKGIKELYKDETFKLHRQGMDYKAYIYATHTCKAFDLRHPPNVMLSKMEDWECPYCHKEPSTQFTNTCLLVGAS